MLESSWDVKSHMSGSACVSSGFSERIKCWIIKSTTFFPLGIKWNPRQHSTLEITSLPFAPSDAACKDTGDLWESNVMGSWEGEESVCYQLLTYLCATTGERGRWRAWQVWRYSHTITAKWNTSASAVNPLTHYIKHILNNPCLPRVSRRKDEVHIT